MPISQSPCSPEASSPTSPKPLVRPSSTRLPEAKAGSSVRTPAILERLYGTGVVLPTPFSPESEFCAVLMNGKINLFSTRSSPKISNHGIRTHQFGPLLFTTGNTPTMGHFRCAQNFHRLVWQRQSVSTGSARFAARDLLGFRNILIGCSIGCTT